MLAAQVVCLQRLRLQAVRWRSRRPCAAVAAGGTLRNGCPCCTPTQLVMFFLKGSLANVVGIQIILYAAINGTFSKVWNRGAISVLMVSRWVVGSSSKHRSWFDEIPGTSRGDGNSVPSFW